MENPARTQAYHARITDRRKTLDEQLARLIPPGGPITWEVGSGHGHFLTAYAAQHPGEFCVGVDITKDRIDRGLRKRNRAAIENLHFIHCDARDFLQSLPAGVEIEKIFILF